jgi:ADP-ribose pyrophosphatase YjhB (NUDIX family)
VTESWIVEVRRRLAAPVAHPGGDGDAAPAPAGAGDARRAAALVPLYVDAGELWTVLTSRAAPVGQVAPMAFPGALLEPGEEAWHAAMRGGEAEAGLEPRVMLDLGRLEEAVTPAGVVIVPCVGALPTAAVHRRKPPGPESAVLEVVPLPLSALANPSLVESRPAELGGATADLQVFHLGRRRLWGATARVAGELLARLGLGGPLTLTGG